MIPALANNMLLLYTTNDIIDFSSIEMGNFNFSFKPFDIEEAIQDCFDIVNFNIVKQKNELLLEIV